jgi:hypothetical protein
MNEYQEPVAWVDPATLYQLKIGLEGVHLVYETEMVNSLPLYEQPKGWRDNVAQAYQQGFEDGCKSMSARNGTQNIGSLGMPVNVPVTPPQRTWVGLTDEDRLRLWLKTEAEDVDRYAFAKAVEAALKELNT